VPPIALRLQFSAASSIFPSEQAAKNDLVEVARLFHGGQRSRAGDVNKWLKTGSEAPRFGETVLRQPLRSLNVLAELQRERFLVLRPSVVRVNLVTNDLCEQYELPCWRSRTKMSAFWSTRCREFSIVGRSGSIESSNIWDSSGW
jgi:hypothetical protein